MYSTESMSSMSYRADPSVSAIGSGPLKPPTRPIPRASTNESMVFNGTKVFDFSALFSSPGLSVFRQEAQISLDPTAWLGFTLLPEPNFFCKKADEISLDKLYFQAGGGQTPSSVPPCTPARSSVSPRIEASSHKRKQANANAMQEIVNYGILKTAQKAPRRKSEMPVPQIPQSPTSSLERRHRQLLTDIENIESQYGDILQKQQCTV